MCGFFIILILKGFLSYKEYILFVKEKEKENKTKKPRKYKL